MRLEGHCQCGAIRYIAEGEPRASTLCHCTICRRSSGAPTVAWFTLAAREFRIVTGTPVQHATSLHGTRTFCGTCGTPLTFRSSRAPDDVDVTTGSLADASQVPPVDHTYTASQLRWLHVNDGLPRFSQARPAA